MAATATAAALRDRQVALLERVGAAERATDLLFRQEDLLAQIGALEAKALGGGESESDHQRGKAVAGDASAAPELPADASETHAAIHNELVEM